MPTLTPSAQAQDHRSEDGQCPGDERADEKLLRLLPVSSSLISGRRMIPLAAMTVPGTRTRLMIPMTSNAQRTMTARPVGNALSQTSQAAPARAPTTSGTGPGVMKKSTTRTARMMSTAVAAKAAIRCARGVSALLRGEERADEPGRECGDGDEEEDHR